jgi:hypothetical protein
VCSELAVFEDWLLPTTSKCPANPNIISSAKVAGESATSQLDFTTIDVDGACK